MAIQQKNKSSQHIQKQSLGGVRFKALLKLGVFLVLAIGLTGCVKKQGGAGSDMNGAGVGDSMTFYGTNLTPEQERDLLAKNTYYFGYDRFDVCEEDVMSIYAHAKKILCNPQCRVRVEGHTDERGSREYNVALGERRAKAVANVLILKGVPAEKICVVSYGKEKPAAFGHDESAWSQNRRGVIIYESE